MERRPFGRTGISFPAVGMGTWNTFDVTRAGDKRACKEVVSTALSAGANLFDSSPMYGHAERVLAESLGERRSQAIVATKVWANSGDKADRQIENALALYGGSVDHRKGRAGPGL